MVAVCISGPRKHVTRRAPLSFYSTVIIQANGEWYILLMTEYYLNVIQQILAQQAHGCTERRCVAVLLATTYTVAPASFRSESLPLSCSDNKPLETASWTSCSKVGPNSESRCPFVCIVARTCSGRAVEFNVSPQTARIACRRREVVIESARLYEKRVM
jgi:hypothetical protein